jgi:hypothetical protein
VKLEELALGAGKTTSGQCDLLRAWRERFKRLGHDLFHLFLHILHAFVRIANFLCCRSGPNGLARFCADQMKDDMAVNRVPDILGDSVNRSLGFVQARSWARMKALDVSRKAPGTGFVGNEEIWICSILDETFVRQIAVDVLHDLLVDQLIVLLAQSRDEVILAPGVAPATREIEVLIKIRGDFLRGEGRAD